MGDETNKTGARSADSLRLGALLDQLVAVQLDLEPICKVDPHDAAGMRGDLVGQACKELRSAIVDLRGIIERLDGPPSP
jgi:hypothetical protein